MLRRKGCGEECGVIRVDMIPFCNIEELFDFCMLIVFSCMNFGMNSVYVLV